MECELTSRIIAKALRYFVACPCCTEEVTLDHMVLVRGDKRLSCHKCGNVFTVKKVDPKHGRITLEADGDEC